jgi:deazaflavin-dependent oxidoreductase (nitroreductase family)
VLGKAGLVQPIEHALVRHTGLSMVTWATRVNRGLEYIPTLLLTTVGRRSGALHEVALGYYVHDGRVVLVGSVGGAAEHPDWYHNLCEHPLVWLTVNRRRHACDTHTATGTERAEIWSIITARVPEYAAYERRAEGHDREMPVVVCTPRAAIPGLRPW